MEKLTVYVSTVSTNDRVFIRWLFPSLRVSYQTPWEKPPDTPVVIKVLTDSTINKKGGEYSHVNQTGFDVLHTTSGVGPPDTSHINGQDFQ